MVLCQLRKLKIFNFSEKLARVWRCFAECCVLRTGQSGEAQLLRGSQLWKRGPWAELDLLEDLTLAVTLDSAPIWSHLPADNPSMFVVLLAVCVQ